MIKPIYILIAVLVLACHLSGQSGRVTGYSETPSPPGQPSVRENNTRPAETSSGDDGDVIRVDTDLVVIPVQVSEKKGRPVVDLKKTEFKIFENGVEQEIAYFSDEDQPFTVALMLDMSYSSVFKLGDIQAAAWDFVNQLRENDRVMVVAFAGKVRILCEPTDNRKVLRYAIDAARIDSGTAFYSALDTVLSDKFASISGRKAIVLLSDGVDTRSANKGPASIIDNLQANNVLIYPVRYDTFDDVQKSRRNDAQIQYDDDDRPYIVERPREKGEREADYREARDLLKEMAGITGGRVYPVSSTTNLNAAFAQIANELRKTYSIGYYPEAVPRPGERYSIKVRVYRPGLTVRARENYIAGGAKKK